MNIIYYSEVNLICIIILLLFQNQMHHKSEQFSASNRIFNLLIWVTILTCTSDMIAGAFRGQIFRGARIIIEISNMIFYETLSAVSFLWMIYVFIKLKIIKTYEKKMFILTLPLILFSFIVISNPFTHLLFKIDENNLYVRNVGMYIHWAVAWLYLILTTAQISYSISKENSKQRRKEIIPFLYFIIAPAVASIVQMIFYGVTSSQVGITISIVIISLNEQNKQILTDALTGLNNRHGFNKYIENYMQHHIETKLSVMIIDIDNFKQVNDKFSHMTGDCALADVADVIKSVCEKSNAKLFVCRYGGDEFLIVGCNCEQKEIINLKTNIKEKLEEKNHLNNYPYILSVSIGIANGKCMDSDDVNHLLRVADEAMYGEKKKLKVQERL